VDAAASRPFGQSVERSFYCRSCRLTARGRWIPTGWYVLERAAGGGGRHLRVGLYCSLACLAAAGSDLAAAEQDAGVRRGLPAGAARGRARLVEIAQTLMHRGATIRAAGDELGVPTSTLRHWLREAGVRVGADGTLTGSAGPAPPPGKAQKDHGSGAGGTVTATAAPASADRPAPSPAATGGAPVQVLNELAQTGYVTDLAWETGMDGAAHRPVFSCTVTARVAGIATPVRARGTGGSKAAAKASAAAALLAGLAEDDPAGDDAPVRGEDVPC
jgi:ribonuclease R